MGQNTEHTECVSMEPHDSFLTLWYGAGWCRSHVAGEFQHDHNLMLCCSLSLSSLNLLSQSLQSWHRPCGLLSTTRPSVPLISGARFRFTLPNSWAASRFPPRSSPVEALSMFSASKANFPVVSVNRTPRSFCAAFWKASIMRWTEWLSAPRCSSRTLTICRKSTSLYHLWSEWVTHHWHLTVQNQLGCCAQDRRKQTVVFL